jgi:hypothetical protein
VAATRRNGHYVDPAVTDLSDGTYQISAPLLLPEDVGKESAVWRSPTATMRLASAIALCRDAEG